MAITAERIGRFLAVTIELQSFMTFCGYLLMIACAGIWQKATSPLSLRPVLVVYNFTCCFLSVYTTIGFLRGIYDSGNIYLKEPREELKSVFYLYWITKNIELMDTVFMILRHRSRQITFLHVYHHSSMVLLSDFGYHYTPWPAIAVILALNSFVHVLLYFYYGLTAWNPDNTPTWKKRLTEVQIIQFLIDFVFAAYGYVHHGFCIYGLIYGILMTYLFSNFYYAAYIKKRSTHAKKA